MWRSRFFWRILLAIGLPNLVLATALLVAAGQNQSPYGEMLSVPLASLIAIVGSAWIALVCYWVARRVSGAARQVQHSAEAVEKGDFSQRVLIRSPDELGAAASAFNDMRETLEHRFAELQKNGDRMETVLSGMVEGVLAVDSRQRVLLANEACRKLLGISIRDVVGRPLLEVVRNLDVQQAILKALRGNEAASREVPLASASHRVVQVLATRLAGNPCPGVVVVLHDVTDLRRLENLRRDFVANVSHELKTPLSAIKAYAETLRLGAIHDQDNNIGFVERIEEQATRLHRLIVDLLHLARVETGKEAFEFEEVSVRDICDACLIQHSEVAAAAGITLIVEDQPDDTFVWADADGVRIIADNLVTNAIKFTPPQGSITLRWRRERAFGVLEIEDTGIGIPRQDQERVFERFYRADKARSRDMGGTGLGLAIVKHLAQAFGGEVGLTSELGRGSTFRISLPLAAKK
jgi:two-component system phosphate regulon sensor histidine kinase PhoR